MSLEIKIKCPFCKAKIPSDALRCSHCAADLNTKESQEKIKKEVKQYKIGVIAIFLFFVVIFIIGITNKGNNTSPTPSSIKQNTEQQQEQILQTPQEDLLELLSFRCYTEYSYFHIVGEVKNISDKPLEDVMAVGTAYTENGEFVKSDDALIDYNPILPGQTSPFEILVTDNPAIKRCKVSFKEFWGGSIPTKRK